MLYKLCFRWKLPLLIGVNGRLYSHGLAIFRVASHYVAHRCGIQTDENSVAIYMFRFADVKSIVEDDIDRCIICFWISTLRRWVLNVYVNGIGFLEMKDREKSSKQVWYCVGFFCFVSFYFILWNINSKRRKKEMWCKAR